MPVKNPKNRKIDRLALCDHFVDYKTQNFPFFNSKIGFTLIELLVVLAVIGILATVVLANYNNFGQKQAVTNAAGELKSDLRKYQTLAISGQKNPVPASPNCYDPTDPSLHPMDYYSVKI